ncbi:hypothetical protein DCC39_07240 [Pueribacillus theae]|uniref:Adenosylcobinamide amidohydrolase n=1 Tax=Pueribacillus theae TaxID=2171751 RepID=A0A2U1K5M2_9BACI|nr:adenosylcobinamide amidohydrolase [Pueribacillus theae]PWA12218.1 hypothetical protein DCC39_07240 [Pueribacillus theae]
MALLNNMKEVWDMLKAEQVNEGCSEKNGFTFSGMDLYEDEKVIKIEFPYALKTLSSAVIGSGLSWKKAFVNRHVDKDYNCDDPMRDMLRFIKNYGLKADDSIAMLTAAHLQNLGKCYIKNEEFELFVIVTAGVGNSVDVSQAKKHEWLKHPIGTINCWVFINGYLAEEAFIHALMTATEAKSKAFFDEKVMDPVTKTIATGTSTDSMLIAATQQGAKHQYAGTITTIGKEIGEAVYKCTVEAIRKSRRSKL